MNLLTGAFVAAGHMHLHSISSVGSLAHGECGTGLINSSLQSEIAARNSSMETSRLRSIQHPSRATLLLESLIEGMEMVPPDSDRVISASELTAPLRRLVRKSESGEAVWCAWTKGPQIWFFFAIPSLELARERRKPVLQVTVHDEHGEITATAPYVSTPHGWQRCT